jgi:hypothetical protein
VKVLEKLGWKPPSSKDSGITDADTLFNETTIKHVKKFYDEEIRFVIAKSDGSDIQTADHRVAVMGPGKVSLPTKLKHAIYHSGVPRLGDENTSVWNYGAGKTGLDWTMKKVSEVYRDFNHKENENFIYVITIPHSFRRMFFEENGTARRTWDKPVAAETNHYNHFLYLYHHYEILNRLIGRDKIIWGTWDDEIPKDMIDVFFDLHDYAGRHPGPESHRLYAEKIKDIMRKSGWYGQES